MEYNSLYNEKSKEVRNKKERQKNNCMYAYNDGGNQRNTGYVVCCSMCTSIICWHVFILGSAFVSGSMYFFFSDTYFSIELLDMYYSQNSHIPYILVDSPGYGFSGVMSWRGWEKNKCSRKLTKTFEKILFSLLQWVCWTRRQTFNAIWASHCWCTSPQWCWLHDWAKIDLDCRLIPENLVMNRVNKFGAMVDSV